MATTRSDLTPLDLTPINAGPVMRGCLLEISRLFIALEYYRISVAFSSVPASILNMLSKLFVLPTVYAASFRNLV
ncbi:hypothetical protein [Arsukibacterium sp.]|uniref:hypothetical protein n=1 Tax=Arsukibacterium sp. TaxID=1977258 RepID=UPI001BD3F5E3|nr:hypothetical protein [Arsukibacterium sp.]